MGFKRSSDGRVFFQGTGETANDDPVTEEQIETIASTRPKDSQSQLQMLTLLKSLNERLKATQAERGFMRKQLEDYRDIIHSLEQKSSQSEKALHKLEQRFAQLGAKSSTPDKTEEFIRDTLKEMEKTRRILLKLESKTDRADQSVSNLKQSQQVQSQKLSKANDQFVKMTNRIAESEEKQNLLNDRIDDALTQQERLSRKIDQAIEDRARFMRKIERIEEAVIQTRDSLNAQAVALMNDPTEEIKDQKLGEALLQQKEITATAPTKIIEQKDEEPWHERVKPLVLSILNTQAALIPGLFFIAIVAGVYIGTTSEAPETITPTEQAVVTTTIEKQDVQTWSVEEDTTAFAQDVAAVSSFPSSLKAVGLESEEQMVQMMETEPQVLGGKMNQIEPGEPVVAKEAPFAPSAAPASIPQDTSLPEIIKQVEQSAQAGSPEAQHDLAAIYIAGHGGVEQNYGLAAQWFRKAADQGIGNAAYNLGVLHHQGLGVNADLKEAIYWYESAAQLGHPEAQYNLGIAYIEGIGVPYVPSKAAQYFEAAAKSDVTEAAYNLGLIHENGLLGQPKPDEALMWYKKAADKGSPEARTALEQLAKTLGVSLADVNKLVEDVQAIKLGTPKTETSKPAPVQKAKASAPKAKKAPVKKTKPVVTKKEEVAPLIENIEPVNLVADEIVAESNDPLASVEREFEQILTSQIQEQLMNLGLYPGPADGISGPLTVDAISTYQAENNLAIDGKPTAALLDHMVESASGN